ncbi:MAG: ABC transporter permease [Candidatus Hodarchaeales archaeon]
MLRLALRNIKRSRWRTSLLIFGILITIALETGIVVTIDTVFEDFLYDNRNQNYTDITVNPKTGLDIDSLKELAKVVNSVQGVKKSSEVFYISSDLIQNQSGGLIDILVYGINSKTHPDYPSLNILDGSPIIDEKTVLISEPFKETLDIHMGETLVLDERPEIGFNGAELVIGGIFSIPPFFGNREGQFIILVPIDTLISSFQAENLFSSLRSKIDVKVDNLLRIESIADGIIDTLGPNYNVYVEKEISELQSLAITAYTSAINLIILASLLMEFLFLTNILTIVIRDRRKEYGILRTIGISSKQLLTTIFYEILIYSIIGIILGLIIGIGFANLLVETLDWFYPSLDFQVFSIKSSSLAIIVTFGIFIALLAGLYPVYLALKVPVIRNIHFRMRSSESSLISNYWKYTIVFGTILIFSGFIFSLFTTPAKFLEFSIFSGHFLVIIYIFLGTLLIEAGFLVLLPKIGEKVLIFFDKVPRQISMRNISREFHKSLFTLISSSVAITFIILVAIISNVVILSVPQYYENQWGTIDLVVEANDNTPYPINFTDELVSNEMIKQASYIQETRLLIGSVSTNIYGVDPDQYAFFRETTYDKISSEPSHVLLTENSPLKINALVSDVLFNSLNIPLGDNISMQVSSFPPVNITIAAIIKGNAFLSNGRYLYLASDHFQRLFNTTTANLFICDVHDGLDIYEAQRNISSSYPNLSEVFGVNFYRDAIERSLKFQASLFQILFMQSFILAGLAQFVSIIISTINMEREIGIIRSMGLSRWGVFSIYLAESTTLGICSLIFGLLDGIFGAALLLWYLSDSIPIQLIIPVDQVLLWLAFSFVLTLISTIVPALRSSRNEIAATISARPVKRIPERKGIIHNIREIGNKILNILYYIILIIIAYFVLIISILIIGYIIVFILWVFNDIF